MKAIDALNQVAEFHNTFNAPVLSSPQIPAQNRANLRYNLLAEELEELKEAIAAHDIVAVADALCDLQYVLAGAILEFGLGEGFVNLFDEVQRSNMSKACISVTEANDTVDFYKAKDGTEAYVEKSGEKFLVFRTADNKVLKSINYSPADLAKFL